VGDEEQETHGSVSDDVPRSGLTRECHPFVLPLRATSTRAFIQLFAVIFLFNFLIGIGVYWFLHSVCGQDQTFGGLYRMFCYHDEHPAQYIGIVAVVFALFAATWTVTSRSVGWRCHLGLLGVFIATLLLSSALGGILYTFHDMQAGFFPSWERRKEMFLDGVTTGIACGWLIVIFSFPLNIITAAFAYVSTFNLVKWRRKQ
jgi:hypothetical protein